MIVCYVTDRKLLSSADTVDALPEKIELAAQAGADWIQIREKDLSARELLDISRRAIAAAPKTTRILINDRLEVAIAAGAAGVHLGRESAPAEAVVRWCRGGNAPANFLIGVSCHALEEAKAAEKAGADYVFFGPVFETPAKRQFGTPQGVERLAEVCRGVRIPVIAIGGIHQENAAECGRAGAAGVAAIRLFQSGGDEKELKRIISGLHGA